MSEFVRLTSREPGGGDLFLRRDMVAAVGSYGGKTHVTLINEDIDYEVRESVREVMVLLGEKTPDKSLTINNQCGTMSGQRRNCARQDSQNKRKVPSGSREAPTAVPPVAHDAPSML